mgnify:CR=1 FL=1
MDIEVLGFRIENIDGYKRTLCLLNGTVLAEGEMVGCGMRLCVNDRGERQDESVLHDEVDKVNELTVVASESYGSFAAGLQREMAEAVGDRPQKVQASLFEGLTMATPRRGATADGCINQCKAIAVVEHVAYHKIDKRYDADIFSGAPLKGKLGVNAMVRRP